MNRNFVGIFLISASTLLFEVSLTRVFSVLFFHHFAFLIISTALFGFGFSGIYLLFFKKDHPDISNRLSLGSLLFAVTILVTYWLMLILPYEFQEVMDEPIRIFRLVVNYALLTIPFFFSGYVIGLLLSSFPSTAGKYYCFDLAGAAIGCISVLWFVPLLGASGSIVVSSVLAALSALVFWPTVRMLRVFAAALVFGTAVCCLHAEDIFSLPLSRIFQEKHGWFYNAPNRRIDYSAWSPVSRIDVLVTPPSRLIYLDGGSNVSFMIRYNPDSGPLKPRLNWRSIPYLLSPKSKVCIIGPGGGEDVLNALSHGSNTIRAIEMDPLIVQIVQGKYREFVGGIFNHPSVRLINDEGRSFLQRTDEQFDLIQTVHNCSPMAFASGAFNLSESYLFTVESFQEYWRHLRPGGMLAIHRAGILRAAPIASVILEKEGIPDPENFVVVTSKRGDGETGFFLKKGRISQTELQNLFEAKDQIKIQIRYAPLPQYQTEQNVYYRLLVPSLREKMIREADIVLKPPTDNWPFFDHYQPLGRFRERSALLEDHFNFKFYNLGDFALFTLLGEAALLAFVFILFPLVRMRRTGSAFSNWVILVYFAALGAGFILIEISLMQKHILFLGQPVYSIASVLFALLLSAGMGSLFFQSRFQEGKERNWIVALALLLILALAMEVFLVPKLFTFFLGAPPATRFFLSGIFILPLGFLLGIPFPLGIRVMQKRNPESIPWAWGLNAYATVVGSILCVIFAVTLGFNMNFLLALLIYLTGFLALYSQLRVAEPA